MKTVRIVWLMVLACGVGARAEQKVRVHAAPYFGTVDYGSASVRSHAQLGGIYTYLDFGHDHSLEAEFGYSRIHYRSGFVLDQQDYTLVYTNLSIPNWKFRVGTHFLTSADDPYTDGGWAAIAGAHYYIPDQWDAGVDFYFSRYDDYVPDVNVVQLTPHVGINLWKHKDFTLRSDVRWYYIKRDEHVDVGDTGLHSVEGKLSVLTKPVSLAVFGWVGEQTFALRNEGFTLYNLPDRHTGGFGGEVQLRLWGDATLKLKVCRETMKDFWTREHTGAVTFTVLVRIPF